MVDELYLVSDLKFWLNENSLKFELDQNPHGEPKLAEIEGMEANEDFSQITFNSNYRNENVSFQLNIETDYDASIFRIIHSVNNGVISPVYNPDDLDKVEILFKDGKLFQVYLYKYRDYELLETLTVIYEQGEYFIVKQNPWKKIKLENLSLRDEKIICSTSEEQIKYKLDVNEFVLRIVEDLLVM